MQTCKEVDHKNLSNPCMRRKQVLKTLGRRLLKTRGFLTFPGGKDMEHWLKIS